MSTRATEQSMTSTLRCRPDGGFGACVRSTRPYQTSSFLGVDYARVNPETVAWATQNARDLLAEETDRIQALDTKASQLAGFSGVTLAILGSIGQRAIEADLGTVGDPLFASAYFLAGVMLAVAILWLVFFGVRPRRFIAIDASELTAYLEDERLLRSRPWALQIRTLRALRDAASWAQRGAQEKANRLTVGVAIFGLALSATLVSIVTLGIASLN